MSLSRFDLLLLIATIVIMIIDIALAVCLRFAIPLYIADKRTYQEQGIKMNTKQAIQACPCLGAYYKPDSNTVLVFKKVKRSIEAQNLKEYPFLVSLNIPVYSDDDSQRMLACNGLIESRNHILTTTSCVVEDSEWYKMKVRSGSQFWSINGMEHEVIDVSSTELTGLVRLKVFPDFFPELVPSSPLNYLFEGNWTRAVSLGWDENMYKKSLPFRYKYKRFDIDKWTKNSNGNNFKNVCDKSNKCVLRSKPLVTSCKQIVGVQTMKNEVCDGFMSLRSNSTDCYNVYRDDDFHSAPKMC